MFQSDTKWDVDRTADTLNTSLFGKAKKRKAQGITSTVTTKDDNRLFSSIIHDSDDETFSKKGRKKLKEQRRKKNKGTRKSNPEGSVGQATSDDGQLSSSSVSKSNKKKKRRAEETQKQNSEFPTTVPSTETSQMSASSEKKKKKKRKTDEKNFANNVDSVKKKRKRSHSESLDNEQVENRNKRAKLSRDKNDAATSKAEAPVSEDGKKKRRRNRKKKNNSKKNKYKHLALNSKDKTQDASLSQDIKTVTNAGSNKVENLGCSQETLAPSEGSKNSKSTKKAQHMGILEAKLAKSQESKHGKKHGSPQKVLLNNSISSILNGQVQNGTKYSENVSKKRNKKRKPDLRESAPSQNSITENELHDVTKKKKKETEKDISSEKAVISKPQVQPTLASKEAKKQKTPGSKATPKSKLKQHVLAKMLNEMDSNGPGQANEKTEVKQLSNKEKRKLKEGMKKQAANEPETEPHRSNPHQKTTKQKSTVVKDKREGKLQVQGKDVIPKAQITAPADPMSSSTHASLWGKAAELGQHAREKLDSARFRYINEQLYSCKGDEALKMFKDDREAFGVYHQGFENQVSKWPVNPLKVIIKQIKEKPAELVIADFGCGDAKLAQSIPQKVHSFDLVALNNRVTVCDMSKTPLPSEKVDIAVFCLSLMGTNISDYIHEANRVLKTGGLLKVAEVVSRFSGVSRFIDAVCSHGFQLLNKRDLSQMFYLMDFRKVKVVKKSVCKAEIKLKPCMYKKR